MPAAALSWIHPEHRRARWSGLLGAMVLRPLALALVVVVLVTALRMSGTVDSDVAWQLWIAGRIHAGARLYRDIVEVNPPLWFWMALPLDRVATLFHVQIEAVLIGTMGVLSALSLAATNKLLTFDRRHRALFLVYAALILTAMPWMQVGQREQLVLIGALPYAALISARQTRRQVPLLLAVVIGGGAALGFALKHYFLIVPILLELWLLLSQRRSWRPIRPETAAIVAFGLAYGASILLLTPDFLNLIVPMARLAYGVTGATRVVDLLQPAVVVGMITMLLVGIQCRRSKTAPPALGMALLLAALGFLTAYFLQAKGWPYHALPLLGCSSIGLAAFLGASRPPSRFMAICAPAILVMPFVIAAKGAAAETSPSGDLRAAVAGLKAGDPVGFIATDPAFGWSVTLQRRFRYPSRYNGFWMMRAVVENEQRPRPDPRLSALGRDAVSQTVMDFRCIEPRRIVISRPRAGESGFDILPFFLRDPEFAEFLSRYRLVSRTTVAVYQLDGPLKPVESSACRHGV